jgi:transposase-like protein
MGEAGRLSVFGAVNQRRRWSAAAKSQLVTETYTSSVNEIAERYNVALNQLLNGGVRPRNSSDLSRCPNRNRRDS